MFLGFYLISLDTRPDLSDANPKSNVATDDATLCGWPSLRQPDNPSEVRRSDAQVPKNGARVKMLGYMMDGYRFVDDGAPVRMFVLMPGAGHFLHPAHRDPDQMVEIRLQLGNTVFKSRELVWVSGRFERLPAQSGEERAMYALQHASVAPASYRDISQWFSP
jgi:hypothetical protein